MHRAPAHGKNAGRDQKDAGVELIDEGRVSFATGDMDIFCQRAYSTTPTSDLTSPTTVSTTPTTILRSPATIFRVPASPFRWPAMRSALQATLSGVGTESEGTETEGTEGTETESTEKTEFDSEKRSNGGDSMGRPAPQVG